MLFSSTEKGFYGLRNYLKISTMRFLFEVNTFTTKTYVIKQFPNRKSLLHIQLHKRPFPVFK